MSATASLPHLAGPNRTSDPMCVTVSDMEPVTGDPLRARPPRGAAASSAYRSGIGTLLFSATISRLADHSASIALVLLVITRTHSPRLAGLVVAAFTLPTLFTGPVIGAYLDRLRAKRALFAANQAALAAALAAVAVLAGHAPGAVLIMLGL